MEETPSVRVLIIDDPVRQRGTYSRVSPFALWEKQCRT